MALLLRNGIYWIDVTINGKRYRETLSTSDKKEAKQAHDIRRGELWRQGVLKEKPKHTFREAADRWARMKAHKRSIQNDLDKIAHFNASLGDVQLSAVTADLIERNIPTDNKPATRNRYRALVRSILRAAEREWEWLDKAPIIRAEPENNIREVYLTREQFQSLLDELPERYRAAVSFAVLTGLRKANVLGLDWSAVNLDAGTLIVSADDFKTGQRQVLPINSAAKAILASQKGREGLVFGLKRINRPTWQAACKRAGVPGFRFHDLRHTWASWHAMAGTDMQVLQRLGGWSSPAMLKRYVALAPDHLAAAAERVAL